MVGSKGGELLADYGRMDMLGNRLSVDDPKEPAPKSRRIKLELIADPAKRARLVIVRDKPKLGEV